MKKIFITILMLIILTFCGCQGEPRTYGNIIDWSIYESDNLHVYYASSTDGCYSDGSSNSDYMFDRWVEDYKNNH